MASFGFESLIGWLALLSLIPLILLYLIRPKPKEIDVPSLMFFQKDEKRKRERAFFKRMRRDWLFLIQLLALLLLSLFFVKPYMMFGQSLLLDNAIIVLDASASMAVNDHLDVALQKARDVAGASNTLIMVAKTPYVALENADKTTTLQFLDDVRAGAVSSSVGSGMMLAAQYLEVASPEIFVISDFMDTGSVKVSDAKQTLEQGGATVHLFDVGEDTTYHNVGIVDLRLDDDLSEVTIQNFDQQQHAVQTSMNGKTYQLTLDPGEREVVAFMSADDVNTIDLKIDDDLDVDDHLVAVVPSTQDIQVLLLTDEPSPYLRAALSASDHVHLDVYGTLPDKKYDAYVVHQVSGLSTQELSELKQRVQQGAGLVIHVQEDSDTIGYGDLLPVVLGKKEGFANIQEVQPNKFTKGIEIGGVNQHFTVKQDKGMTLLRADNQSIFSLQPLGQGKVAYYGIIESASSFTLNPGYPVFWVTLVSYLGNVKGMSELNREGGSLLSFDSVTTVKTPSTTVRVPALYLHEPGFYLADDDTFAVNLLDEKESALDPSSRQATLEQGAVESASGIKQRLDHLLIVLVMLFLLVELVIAKMRGEF